jgi:hypothetical protein
MTNTGRVSRVARLLLLPLLLAATFVWWVFEDRARVAATPESATAEFRGTDTTTAGSWIGKYGAQGYGLANDSVKYPAYAQVAITGGTPYTWEVPTTDPRGLQRPSSNVRVATCWYAVTSLTIDVNLTDGVSHQVTLYAVDFTPYARSERIDVLDAVSGAVLDTRTLAAFRDGQYLTWIVSGHVSLRVTNTGPINAVVSGLFFDSPPAATTVTLTSPAPRASYGTLARIPLAATATAAAGHRIARVDFLAGTAVIGSVTASPDMQSSFALTWTNAAAGTHALTARATDDTGATITSPPVSVTVTATANPAGLPGSALSAKVMSAADLVYQGAFSLPTGKIGTSSFEYGGPIGFNPDGGTLFVVGNTQDQQVAEIGIPEIRSAATLGAFASATVLQPFADPFEGHRTDVGDGGSAVLTGGLLPYRGQLYLTAYRSYDANGTQRTSHFVSGLDLSVHGDVRGPYQVGEPNSASVHSGYFGLVPAEWQSALGGPVLNGQCCLSIITRTSFGPAVFAIDPAQLGRQDPLPAVQLVQYPSTHPLADTAVANKLFNLTTRVVGVVFPEGTRSVLFIGRHGLGAYCYGEAADCGDTADPAKGPHQPPYVSQVWAYDAIDLAAVRSGQRQAWDVKPYATWTLSLPFAFPSAQISGVCYDAQTGRVFVSAGGVSAEGNVQLIHVFAVRL